MTNFALRTKIVTDFDQIFKVLTNFEPIQANYDKF